MTVRFSHLVQRAGQPQLVTLWQGPEANKEFMRAVREKRILTLQQPATGTKKDSGRIGFHKGKNVSYLIFPRPLPAAEGAHVVGIKYELLREQPVKDPVTPAARSVPRNRKSIAPPEKEFSVVLKRTAVWENEIKVRALNKRQAQEKAAEAARQLRYAMDEALLRDEVRGVRNTDGS